MSFQALPFWMRNSYYLNYKVICLLIKWCNKDLIDFSVSGLVEK